MNEVSVAVYTNQGTITATAIISREPDRSGNFVCDGTDDNVELEASVIYVDNLGGGRIFLKRGQYNSIDQNLVSLVAITGITFFGEGEATVLQTTTVDSFGDVFSVGSGGVGGECTNIAIRDMKIVLDASGDNAQFNACVDIDDGTDIRVLNCLIETNQQAITLEGTAPRVTVECVISGNVINAGALNGINLIGVNRGHIIDDNVISGAAGTGIFVGTTDGPDIIVMNNTVHSCNVGIHVLVDGVSVSGNTTRDNSVQGIFIQATDIIISDNRVYSNSSNGVHITSDSDRCVIVGNQIYENGEDGIRVVTGDYCIITGNTIMNNGQDGAESGIFLFGGSFNMISSNTISDDQGAPTQQNGITLRATADLVENIIVNNTMRGNITFGININAGPINTVVIGNRMTGNGARPIQDLGTDTILATKTIQFIQGTTFISADGSAKGWEINAEADFAIALGQLPLEVQQVLRIKIWAVALGAPAGAGGQMHLDILFNAGGSLEAWNLAANSWTLANFNGEEADYVNTDVIHWVVEDGDVGNEIRNLLGGDSLEMKVNGGTAAAPDGATNAIFRVMEIEYV